MHSTFIISNLHIYTTTFWGASSNCRGNYLFEGEGSRHSFDTFTAYLLGSEKNQFLYGKLARCVKCNINNELKNNGSAITASVRLHFIINTYSTHIYVD